MEHFGSGPRPAGSRERPSDEDSTGGVPLRLVYIPTHRNCPDVLNAVAEEIAAAAKRSSDEFRLLLIDDRPAGLAEANRLAAADAAGASGIDIDWLDVDGWHGFVEALVKSCGLSGPEGDLARTALRKPSGSYAGGMNKAALIAAHLGAATLHRRDSDEFPARDERTGVTTLEVEIAALTAELPAGAGPLAVPFFAGSSVDGEPTRDHRDLDRVAGHFGRDLDALSSRRRPPSEEALPRVAGVVTVSALLDVELERDVVGRTQVGISASREVYRWVPEMPAVGVLGTDHFQKGLLYQFGLPVCWHPMSAYHEYEPWRAEQVDHAHLARYVVSEMRYAVLRYYWNAANETLRGFGPGVFSGEGGFPADDYADAFAGALVLDGAEAVAEGFLDIHRRAVALASGDLRERLSVRVAALREERPRVVRYVRSAIEEFVALTRLWPRLVRGAEELDGSER